MSVIIDHSKRGGRVVFTGTDGIPCDTSKADQNTAAIVGETLHRHYPGHLWTVWADSLAGVVVIRHAGLSSKKGYVIKMIDMVSDPSMSKVIKAGGEILERYGVKRGQFKIDDFPRQNPQLLTGGN